MLLICSADELVRVRMPGTVLSSSSSTSVTADSTTCGLAPGSEVETEMIGRIDVGILAHRELAVPDDAEQHEGHAHHRGEHGSPDGEVGKDHLARS